MSETISVYEIGETPNDLIEGFTRKIGDRLFSTTNISVSGNSGDINIVGVFNLISLFGLGGGGSASGPVGQVGQVLGVLETFLKEGKRPPTTLIANNPLLSIPNFQNQQLYGELMNYVIAWDQPLKKKVAVFPQPQNGGGSMFHNFNMSSLFKGVSTVSDVIKAAISQGNEYEETHPITEQINQAISNVTNILSVNPKYGVDLSRPDNAIPLGAAIAMAFSNDEKSPFTEDEMKKGWLMYTSVNGL